MHLTPHFEPIGPKTVLELLNLFALTSASASIWHFRSNPEIVLVFHFWNSAQQVILLEASSAYPYLLGLRLKRR